MLKWLEGFFLDDKGAKSMSRLGHFVAIVGVALFVIIFGLLLAFGHQVATFFLLTIKMLGGGGAGGYGIGKIADAFGRESSDDKPEVEEDATP